MPSATALRATGAGAERLRALWRAAEAFETRPSMAALGYAPHLTLAVYDAIDAVTLCALLDAAAADRSAIDLTIAAIRHFDGPPLVLWAAPAPSAALDALHRVVHAAVDPSLCRPHFRPGAFVPHCSIATAIDAGRRAEALAFAARPIEPFVVAFDRLDALTFPPVAIAASRTLAPP